jgi:hypothetical protein
MKRNRVFKFKKLFRRFNGLVLLNISGLALGLASVIFIAIWVSHELSYDKFFKNADRIFRVESFINFSGDPSVWSITSAPVAKSLLNDFPEVQDAVVLQEGYQRVIKADDKLFTADNLYYTNHSYFNIFSTNVISGDRSRRENHIILIIPGLLFSENYFFWPKTLILSSSCFKSSIKSFGAFTS